MRQLCGIYPVCFLIIMILCNCKLVCFLGKSLNSHLKDYIHGGRLNLTHWRKQNLWNSIQIRSAIMISWKTNLKNMLHWSDKEKNMLDLLIEVYLFYAWRAWLLWLGFRFFFLFSTLIIFCYFFKVFWFKLFENNFFFKCGKNP